MLMYIIEEIKLIKKAKSMIKSVYEIQEHVNEVDNYKINQVILMESLDL